MRLGRVQLAKRGPSVLWHGVNNTVQIATKPLGFDGASEAERMRWLNGFMRLLDRLDAPLHVLIETEPGPGVEGNHSNSTPRDLDQMRCAELNVEQSTGAVEPPHSIRL